MNDVYEPVVFGLFTAHKRSCRKGNVRHIIVCQSSCSQREVYTPPSRQPPRADTPLGNSPPWQTPPAAQTLQSIWYASYWNAFIVKSISNNLQLYVKPPVIVSTVVDLHR